MNIKGLITQQRLAGLTFLAFFLLYGWFTGDITLDFWAEQELFTAQTFPYLIAVGGAALSFVYVVRPALGQPIHLDNRTWLGGIVILLLLGYSHFIEFAGFPLASALLLAVGFFVLGERRAWLIAVISISVVSTLYLILWALGIHIEPGLIGLLFEVDGR